jgi:hypothetical protein
VARAEVFELPLFENINIEEIKITSGFDMDTALLRV